MKQKTARPTKKPCMGQGHRLLETGQELNLKKEGRLLL
jgi:hypothetical protein